MGCIITKSVGTSEKKNTVVKVMKLTEMQYGAVQIHSVDTDGNIKPTEPKERKLLFIGIPLLLVME